MAVSCTGQSAVPHCGHGKRPPLVKSISISRRRFAASKAQALTIHGGISPRANCIRSVSRIEVSPAVPLSLNPAAVLAPVKEWPGDVEDVSSPTCRPPAPIGSGVIAPPHRYAHVDGLLAIKGQ